MPVFKQPDQTLGQSLPNNSFGGPQSLTDKVQAANDSASYYAQFSQSRPTAQTVGNVTATASASPQASAAQLKNAEQKKTNKDYFVTLTDKLTGNQVVFYNMPEIGEQRSVDYEPISIVQGPGEFHKYKGTKSVQWSINAVLTSRTSKEAARNLEYINRLRAWTMPFFGENTKKDYPGKMGAPPPVLELKGFRQKILGPVPVVLTNINWSYPQDVDWIPVDGENTPFPAVFRISLTLVESYSTQQFNNFSLKNFYNGDMALAWAAGSGKSGTSSGIETPAEVKKAENIPTAAGIPSVSTPPTMTPEGLALANAKTLEEFNRILASQVQDARTKSAQAIEAKEAAKKEQAKSDAQRAR